MNTLFPGRPDYVGPTEGLFGLLHHEELYETSHNVMERVAYVKREKPHNEVETRLHNMIYLGGCEAAESLAALKEDYQAKRKPLDEDYETKRKLLDDDYWDKVKLLDDDYWAKVKQLKEDCETKWGLCTAEIEAYIKSHIPDCAWNGWTLVFPELGR